MTFDKIMTELKNKVFHPIYFLTGDEPFYIDQVSDYIEKNALPETEKSFNQVVIYGNDVDAAAVINTAKRYPMMSKYQVVIVKEAQNIKNIDDLVYYVESPLKSTILVINHKYKKLDKRKKLFLSLSKNAVVLESNKLYESKIPEWITNYLAQKGIKIPPAAAAMLTEFLGNDLGRIVNELDKLMLTLPPNEKTINAVHIEKNIGISKDYNNFELQNALIERNALKANRIINYFDKNQKNNPITLTITSLYFFFSKVFMYHGLDAKDRNNVAAALKISPFFVSDYQKAARSYPAGKVKNIISWLREYDLKSKGMGNVSATPGDLLKELIFKIIHS
ncbi:MAG: DNA polymerase III subunit delta [Bacteroidales bacterium]|nr:DNA polymerase III subunit delta [Bacteroidales bacterium]